MRQKILRTLYRFFPFDLRGDCCVPTARDAIRISCIINFYGRLDLLNGILHSLVAQKIPRETFEVVLVEDRGGTGEGRSLCESFSDSLQIVYAPLPDHHGKMGFSRNYGVTISRGEILLFLDDDTIILQEDFLALLWDAFAENPQMDALVPRGEASFSVLADGYSFHDPYFMTSRCTAYRRSVLTELGGFMSNFVGQEDVEFVIRFQMAGKRAVKMPQLQYRHPPLLVPNFRKPQAVGASFYQLRSRYPLPVWMLALINCSRHSALYFIPVRKYREMGRFGIGFLAGVIGSIFTKEDFRYS